MARGKDSAGVMIRAGFPPEAERAAATALAKNGSVAHRLGRQTARLQAEDARRGILEKRAKLAAAQFALDRRAARAGQRNQKTILRQIHSDSDRLLHRRPPSYWRAQTPSWRIDAAGVRGRPYHQSSKFTWLWIASLLFSKSRIPDFAICSSQRRPAPCRIRTAETL